MATVTIQQYADGNVGIRRGRTLLVMDKIRLVGTLAEVTDTLRWEFLGWGASVGDEELERIAWRVMGVMK